MFFDGNPQKADAPAATGTRRRWRPRDASRLDFVLHDDVPEDFPVTRSAWRFCSRCSGLFFDGFTQKGVCPAGGPHEAAGFVSVLPTTTVKFDDDA
jgi:hypothetical protein